MKQELKCKNLVDQLGKPAGGSVTGVGINIQWQDGPLGRSPDRAQPNGAFVEGVLEAVKQRLEWYQESEFKCEDNATAIDHIFLALLFLAERTHEREERKVEGTHTV